MGFGSLFPSDVERSLRVDIILWRWKHLHLGVNKHVILLKKADTSDWSLDSELKTEKQQVQVGSQTDRALFAGTEKVLVILNNYSINVTLIISVAEWAGRGEDEPHQPSLHRKSCTCFSIALSLESYPSSHGWNYPLSIPDHTWDFRQISVDYFSLII